MFEALVSIRATLLALHPSLWPLAVAVLTGGVVFGIGKISPLKDWSKALQAVPALLIAAALSGASATSVLDALIDGLVGAFASGLVAIGGHHAAPRLAELLKVLVRRFSGQSAAFLLAFALGASTLTGCAALSSALPVITVIAATLDRVAAEVERMDRVVQATFDVYPEIAQQERGEWLEVLDAVQTARIAVVRAAQAAEAADDGDLQKAIAELQVAFNAAQDWLRRHKMLDAQGRYLVAGKVVGSGALTAAELRAE